MCGVSRFSVKMVLSHNTEKLRGGTLLSNRKFLVSEDLTDEMGGSVSWFSVEIVLTHCIETFRRANLQCFRIFSVSENITDKTRDKITTFFWTFILSQYRKSFLGEPFYVLERIWFRKKIWIRGGEGQDF